MHAFDPGEGKVFYGLEVAFEGTQNQTASLNGTDFMGNLYTVCQTTQFNYKPSSNMTSMTIEPQASDVTVPAKTPEEMQAEAEDEEWLVIWHEFVWLYPWFRLHVKVTLGGLVVDVGLNPFLLGGETWQWEGLEAFAAVQEEFIQELVIDVVLLYIEYVVAKGLSMFPITTPAAFVIMIAKGVTRGILLIKDWYDSTRVLASALVNFIIGIMALKTSIGVAFIKALFNLAYRSTVFALYQLQSKLMTATEPIKHARTLIDWVEITMDFTFALISWIRYQSLT